MTGSGSIIFEMASNHSFVQSYNGVRTSVIKSLDIPLILHLIISFLQSLDDYRVGMILCLLGFHKSSIL